MSDLVGDTQHLHNRSIEFSAVHTVTGNQLHGSFNLAESPGFAKLAGSHASVKIVSESLACDIIGPASASVASTGAIAVIPVTAPHNPDTVAKVLSIGGSVYCVHSLYQAPIQQPVRFAAETAHQIKPKPLVGSAPKVVYALELEGASATSRILIRIRGVIEVDGTGFIQPW